MSKIYKYDTDNNPVLADAIVYTSTAAPTAAENAAAGYVNGSTWVRTNISGTVILYVKTSETGAGVATWTVVPAASTAVLEADYNAQTYLAAILDDTPTAVTVGAGEFAGRAIAGNIGVITAAQARAIIQATTATLFRDLATAGTIDHSRLLNKSIAALGAGAVIASGAQIAAGIVSHAPAGNTTCTTGTAAAIVAALPGAQAGTSFLFNLQNIGTAQSTFTAGVGVTLVGGDLVQGGQSATWLGLVTNAGGGAEAVTFYRLQDQTTSNEAEVIALLGAGNVGRAAQAPFTQHPMADDSSVVAAANFVTGLCTAAVIDAGGRTKTTPTAANIAAALVGAATGTWFDVTFINNGAGTMTIAMDASVTHLGNAAALAIATATQATYRVQITGAATANLWRVG